MKKIISTVLAAILIFSTTGVFSYASYEEMSREQWYDALSQSVSNINFDTLDTMVFTQIIAEDSVVDSETLNNTPEDIAIIKEYTKEEINDIFMVYVAESEDYHRRTKEEPIGIGDVSTSDIKYSVSQRINGNIKYTLEYDIIISFFGLYNADIHSELFFVFNSNGYILSQGTSMSTTTNGLLVSLLSDIPQYAEEIYVAGYKYSDVDIDLVTEIYIESSPETQMDYKDEISTDGLKVMATLADGTTMDITADTTISNYRTDESGERTAIIYYVADDGTCFTTNFEYSVEYSAWQWIIRTLFLGVLWY